MFGVIGRSVYTVQRQPTGGGGIVRGKVNILALMWPLVITILGVALLLSNFRLLTLDLGRLWPLALLALGVQILAQGDAAFSWQTRGFRITRGKVERGVLEANSGDVDLRLSALREPGPLAAIRYTARSRPQLLIEGPEVTIRMRRMQTWWPSLADWDVYLTGDVPWRFLLSSHLGDIEADMRGLEVREARIISGIGSIRLTCPGSPAGPIWIRSLWGDVRVEVPDEVEASVRVRTSPLGRVSFSGRFSEVEPGLWVTDGSEDSSAPLSLEISAGIGHVNVI